jgi:hypothetical protein
MRCGRPSAWWKHNGRCDTVTIEINRAHSLYIFRINPFSPRIIDRRLNRHGARWETYHVCNSEEQARKLIYELEKGKTQ